MTTKPLIEKRPDIAARIVRYMRNGTSYVRACAAAGVPRSTADDWLNQGRNNPRAKPVYKHFAEQIDAARDAGIAARDQIISNHAMMDWKAAAWLQARTDPDTYGRVDTVRVGGTRDGVPVRTQQAQPSMDFTGWPVEDIEMYIALHERNGVSPPAEA